MTDKFIYLTRLIRHCNELEKIKNTVSNLEVEKKKLFTINHINSIDLICLFLLSDKHWIYPIKDEKIILIIYYTLLRLELNIVYNEFLKFDKELEKLSISTLKNNRRIINWMKYMFVKLLLNETQKHEFILKNETNNAYLDYISSKNYHEKILKKPKIFPNINIYDDAMSEDDDAMSEITTNSYEVDRSSDFELEPNVKDDYIDDEDYSKIVDDSDDETTDKKDIYKRTFSRTSNKLNKEIMNAYKTKKRRRTNKNKNNNNTNNNKKTIEVIIPSCTTNLNKTNTRSSTKVNKEITNSYKKRRTNKNNKTVEKKTSKTPDWLQNFDNLYWGIPPLQKSNCPIYCSHGPVNENNLSIYFYEKLNWGEEIVTEYDNYKVWSFVDETDTFAYILLDKRLRDWYVMCNKSSSKKISESYSKLALKEFIDGHLVYKSSNISDVVRIAFSALS